ncbi:phosphomannomutase [Fopius arisanus]|uniref:Phosphomannomutase n=1 Tax=Fopius arisanus TaxID=64838 RepID=A0A0C9QA59_9HYME|nr:PREDICTED: phosphomannomutase [Fopius arisanus]XP_011314475.1 PREDICTED: phosphomannomutase [Fopius arisanus]XP_011314476.1 PREDICTED: phosphomannomutase [Fopius arisanus]XP_011314477.1 PREDICTED: phosphomannomutase [Fopius arisanus]XP_011314478.1 PREDICTED: phosphomannomutase [Fopius arisanus]
MSDEKIVCLFDVDGTLTNPRQKIEAHVEQFLLETAKREKFDIGIVSGSDIVKVKEQLGEDVISKYKYVFAENGLIAYVDEKQLPSESILTVLGEDSYQELVNFCLKYISELRLPFKRGTFIELRTGMVNVSPVGRNSTIAERYQFAEYDKENHIREKFIQALKKEFPDLGLTFAIGGQISIDIFPHGWDKTYCLRHIDDCDKIHFFGDRCYEGGNDYQIYQSDLTVGHRVTTPSDTIEQMKILLEVRKEMRNKDGSLQR